MVEQEKPKTFKYGDREYLVDDLLKLHAQQENNFYQFAKERGHYDDDALQGLREAIKNRVQAVRDSKQFTGDGLLDTDTADNIEIATQEGRGWRKKTKYVKQDNTEGAKHYLNTLINNLTPVSEKTTSKKGWDIDKHGFAAYLSGQGLNAKEIFENYDTRDENNPDAKRKHDQRRQLLKKHLINYNNWLQTKGFDFTKNDNEWDDNFVNDLSDLINNFDKFDNNQLMSNLRRIGTGDGFTTAFTSNKFDLTNDDVKTKKTEDDKIKQQYLDEFENIAYNAKRESNPIYNKPFDYSAHDFNGKTANFMNWYADLNQTQQSQYGTYLGRDNQKWNNAWTEYTNSLKSGSSYSDKNLGILLQGTFANQPNGFIDLGDGHYLIRDSVTDNGQGTIYNPTTGYTDTVFLGDIAGKNEDVKNIYKQLAYKYINNKYNTQYDDRPDVFADGGNIIPKHQYGNKVIFNWETSDEAIAPKADTKGVTIETQKARDKYINSDNKSVDNPNAGLTASQKARIGYAIADLTSAVSAFVPGAGTAVSAVTGLGSTIGNFISDLTDDAVTASDAWKNLGMNIGMDALGLIPGGGAASKMGKIIKSLKTVIPTIIALPGVGSMLAESPEIAQSWKKAFDSDDDAKMTYQDYMNILQILNVATAGTTIAKNAYKSSKVTTKQNDKLAIDVLDQNKERKAIILEGEDINKFKEANAKGEAQKFINELEGEGKYTINEITTSNRGKFWGKDENNKFHLFNQNPFGHSNTGKARVLEVRRDLNLNKKYVKTGRWESDLGLNDGELIDMSSMRRYNSEMNRLQGDIDNVTNQMKHSMEDRKKRIRQINSELTPEKTRLTELQTKLHGVPDTTTLQTNKTQLETDLITLENQITAREKAIATAEADLQRLLNKKRIAKKNKASHKAAIRSTRGKVQGHKAILQGYENTKQQHLNDINTIEEQLQMYSELPVTQANVSKLEGILNQLHPSTHTNAYNKLRQMVFDYQTNHNTIEGRTVNWDMDEILDKAGIKNAFKQGGTININKIIKILNNAKG